MDRITALWRYLRQSYDLFEGKRDRLLGLISRPVQGSHGDEGSHGDLGPGDSVDSVALSRAGDRRGRANKGPHAAHGEPGPEHSRHLQLQADGVQAFLMQAMALRFCALHSEVDMRQRTRTYLRAWLTPGPAQS